jgi:hypothetical protein
MSLHPKFYTPIFLWDVKFVPNYTEKLKFMEIDATTLRGPNRLRCSNFRFKTFNPETPDL